MLVRPGYSTLAVDAGKNPCCRLMKARGYRFFGNYAAKAKMMHIQLPGDWPAILDQEMRMAKRSVGRGLGPSRQSQPIQVAKLATLPEELLADYQANITGTYWLLQHDRSERLLHVA